MRDLPIHNACPDAVILDLYNAQHYLIGVDKVGEEWTPFVFGFYADSLMDARAGQACPTRGEALMAGIALTMQMSGDQIKEGDWLDETYEELPND